MDPQKLEQQRQNESSTAKLKLNLAEQNIVDAQQIENATPSDLKAMGIAKLPLLLLTVGNQVKQIINPSLENIIKKYLSLDRCASKEEIQLILNQRNNIVNQLNKISKTLNKITIVLTGVSTFLTILEATITGIDLAKIAAQIAAIAFPPLAATLPVTLNTLNQAKTQAIIDDKGNSRLSKLTSIIGGAALVSSIIGGYILLAINQLNSIDLFLKKCDPTLSTLSPSQPGSLVPISKETQDIATTQQKAESTQNQTTYNGFIIEIEEVPYTPTVTRRRAVGKNAQGIILIQTELSFTTNDQTLINELKLIIDRDNLKAY